MRRYLTRRAAVAAAASLLALEALAPLGASAGPAPGLRTAADASPSPSASAVPAGCPDLSDGTTSLKTIIATGAAKMVECAKTQNATYIRFDAYFPAATCNGCGGISLTSIDPAWLSGGAVDFDPATLAITSALSQSPLGMRVTTSESPYEPSDDGHAAWYDAHAYDLRVPPDVGACVVSDTSSTVCTLSRYAGLDLRFMAHFVDSAAATCTSEVIDGPQMPAAGVVAYCEQQIVVDGFTVLTPYVCPAAPYTVEGLGNFTSERLLACFGSTKIVVTGYVPAPVESGVGSPWGGSPSWLVESTLAGFQLQGGPHSSTWLRARIPPSLGACDTTAMDLSHCPFRPFARKWVRIVGHFGDARSATCTGSWSPMVGPRPAWFTRAGVRQYCREQFVLLSKPVLTTAPK
ncbi:MAG: hypothetical protein WCH74_09050 [Chloroflexota bacterium]